MDPSVAIVLRLLAAIGVSLLVSLTVARVVRGMGRRGSGVIGGVCAGVALGPAVLGGVSPGLYAGWMVGGVEQATAAARIEAALPGEMKSLRASGVSEVAASEHEAARLADARRLRHEAERDRTLRRAAAGAMAGSCALLTALLLARPVRVRWSSAGAGVISAALSGLAAAVVMRWLLGSALSEAVAAGAVFAGGSIAWRGGSAARSAGGAGLAVSAAGLAVVAGGWTGIALVLMAGLGVVLRAFEPSAHGGRAARAAAELVLVPTCAALTVSLAGTDLTTAGAVLIAAAWLFAGDAQLIGWWLGVKSAETGRWRERWMTAWLLRFGRGGPSWQLLLLGLAVAGMAVDARTPTGSAIVYAVAGAAAVSAITRPTAQRMLGRLRRDLASLQ